MAEKDNFTLDNPIMYDKKNGRCRCIPIPYEKDMTKKRFGIIKTKTYGLYVPVDKMKVYNFSSFESELDCIRVVNALNDLEEKSRENGKIASKYLEENKQLKKELFEARKDYIFETYADNPIRRDERLKALEKELQE